MVGSGIDNERKEPMEKLAINLKPGDKYLEQRLDKTYVIEILKGIRSDG